MATMFPVRLPGNASPSEKPVYRALEQLPDPWRVFHSVAWQSLRKGRQGDGEADFVLIHPRHGLIVIEAKGGSIHIRDGKWFTSNKKGTHPIDPFEQATITSNTYWDWYIRHVFLLVPAQDKVAAFLSTFEEYPPRQKAASFTVDQVLQTLQKAHGG